MKVKTVADLKRLPIGTKLRLIRHLLGTANASRTLARVNSVYLMFKVDGKNELSHLPIPRASHFFPTENGFCITEENGEVGVEYVFED